MDVEYEKLDDDWINNFEKTDKLYKDFYKDDLYYINLQVIYVNIYNEIDKIKNRTFLFTNKNKISQEEILGILKRNSTDNEKKYSLLSILRYNILLEPEHIKNYLLNLLLAIIDSPHKVNKNIFLHQPTFVLAP